MKAWLMNTSVELKLILRDRQSLFWSFIFPLFFLFIFATVFGRTNPHGVTGLMPGLLCITAMSAGLFGLSIGLVASRERGILRRYRLAPVRPWMIISSLMVANFIVSLSALIFQLALAKAIYRVSIAGSVAAFVLTLSIGLMAFMAIGMVIAAIAENTKLAIVLSNVLFFPLMFLGGAAMPAQMLSPSLQKVSKLLPSNHLVTGLGDIMTGGGGASVKVLIVLAVTAIVGVMVAASLFRWESQEKLSLVRKALAAAVILASVAAAVVAGR